MSTSATPEGGTPPPEAFINSEVVMGRLGISRTKLWQLVKSEGLPAYKLGAKGDYRYLWSEIQAWLVQYKQNAPPAS
jgi:predicted DNA-binding transcriptional regulator AlpA